MKTIETLTKGNKYPGRGVLIGNYGRWSVIAYFIMGRSENSRNRVFREADDALTIHPFDASKVEDPSLIIYSPVRVCKGNIVVTNGDQTDTICEYLAKGESFEAALDTRCYEPDAPNFTPRISGMVEPFGTYRMGILRKESGGDICEHAYWRFEAQDGTGRLIHTYETDGKPIPSFVGEPRQLKIDMDCNAFADRIWDCLDAKNKVSLYVRYTDLSSGKFISVLRNKRLGD